MSNFHFSLENDPKGVTMCDFFSMFSLHSESRLGPGPAFDPIIKYKLVYFGLADIKYKTLLMFLSFLSTLKE